MEFYYLCESQHYFHYFRYFTSIYCKVAKIVKKVWTLPLVVKYQKQRIRFVEVGNVVTLLKEGGRDTNFEA